MQTAMLQLGAAAYHVRLQQQPAGEQRRPEAALLAEPHAAGGSAEQPYCMKGGFGSQYQRNKWTLHCLVVVKGRC